MVCWANTLKVGPHGNLAVQNVKGPTFKVFESNFYDNMDLSQIPLFARSETPATTPSPTIALVSCVAQKLDHPAHARDLYTSPLFVGLRRYAATHADAWFILSAKYGLADPNEVIAPYELTLNTMGTQVRKAWASRVREALAPKLPPGCAVILLAGQRYREFIEPWLRERGHSVSVPLEGLPIGRQLQWLKQHR